jgi:hypothetical protein
MNNPGLLRTLSWSLPATALLLIGAGCTSMPATTNETPSAITPVQIDPIPAPVSNLDATNLPKQLAFQIAMHRLWDDHITWTRLYIISVAEGLNDKDQVAARLLSNQVDIGNAIKPFYGVQAGEDLTALLKEHITGAVVILDAAKAKDTPKLNDSITKWRMNGDKIATFLSAANPDNWPLQTMKDAMKMHLDTTLTEATDRLGGKYEQDVQDYDKVKDHIYAMADVLASGIIKQHLDKF